jgi:hypothetical protein
MVPGLVTFQELVGHMWLIPIVSDGADVPLKSNLKCRLYNVQVGTWTDI